VTTLTLLIRIYNSHQLRQIDKTLGNLLGELNVDADVTDTLAGRWVQLELSGEDESIATNLIAREIGFCPTSLEGIKKFAALKGYVVEPGKSEELLVDVGVFQPKPVYAAISLSHLQNQLAGGKKLTLKRISELWGFSENLPLNIKIINIESEENRIEAELQPTQIRRFTSWRDSLLDRLIILGASLYEINTAIEQERLNRDIIDIEQLGMFEHALVCKLGTDGAGLISRMGRRLRKAKFTVFNPKKILTLAETIQIPNPATQIKPA
jgi:hypothetical protein